MSSSTAPLRVLGKRAPDGVYEIPVIGDIGFFGVNGEDLLRELMWAKPSQVRFTIYSPGGAVYDAIAVVGYMQANNIESFTEIYGYCASAATVFAAHSGPKNTSIAPGSMFLVHMPYGGDEKALTNATEFLIDLYVKSYGWTKAEARKHMEANEGNGVMWTAKEAKSYGVLSEIMEGAKVAAHYNINTTMSNTTTVKVQAKVSLSTLEAIRAAVGEGATVEVEVPVDEATQQVIADKDARIAQLEGELEAAKQEGQAAAEAQSAIDAAKAEADAAKAEKEQAVQANAKALEDLKAAHAAEIAELKKPLAKRTEANNADVVPGGGTQTKENPNVVALKNVLKNATVVTPKKA